MLRKQILALVTRAFGVSWWSESQPVAHLYCPPSSPSPTLPQLVCSSPLLLPQVSELTPTGPLHTQWPFPEKEWLTSSSDSG